MKLGLALGLNNYSSGEGGGGAPADPASVVDSIQGSGTAGTVAGDTTLTATGSNRQVVVMMGAGTSDGVTDISATITGSDGTVSIPRLDMRDTTGSSFETFATFAIKEASLPGNGPYTIAGTSTGSNVPDKMGLVAVSIEDAPSDSAPAPVFTAGALNSGTITPDNADSLVLAFQGSSTYSGTETFTNATLLENVSYGDGIRVGWAQQGASALTVTSNVTGRAVWAMFAFGPGGS